MYDYLRGVVKKKLPTAVVVETAGVGWFVETSLRTSGRLPLGSEATVLTHHRPGEDATRLFGFVDEEERELFRRLLKVAGVGPAHALALLSTYSPAETWRALAAGDERALTRPKGLGQKLAQRLITELRDDAARRAPAETPGAADVDLGAPLDDAAVALTVLGYAEAAARKAAFAARKKLGAAASTDALVIEALRAAT
ncbi:MAG TPA: Holliday junction branch migration protein RuvA [Planctomycetota bacterium]|nr:Holliday junction branch migration protein RuvA [Planctomycetota bacterium]